MDRSYLAADDYMTVTARLVVHATHHLSAQAQVRALITEAAERGDIFGGIVEHVEPSDARDLAWIGAHR